MTIQGESNNTKTAIQDITEKLRAPFPSSDIKFREQAGQVFIYIDSRSVQDRLDDVFGIDGWETRFEVHGDKTFCYITCNFGGIGFINGLAIKAGIDRKVTKSDCAGDTNIEGEKGAASDAFKRAAVHFGIGRYLYDKTLHEFLKAARKKVGLQGLHQAYEKYIEKKYNTNK